MKNEDIQDDLLSSISNKIEILRIGWDTWNEMCDFIDVGNLGDGKPEGCYLNKEGHYVDGFPGDFEGNMGILFPTKDGLMTAKEGAYVIKVPEKGLFVLDSDVDIYIISVICQNRAIQVCNRASEDTE